MANIKLGSYIRSITSAVCVSNQGNRIRCSNNENRFKTSGKSTYLSSGKTTNNAIFPKCRFVPHFNIWNLWKSQLETVSCLALGKYVKESDTTETKSSWKAAAAAKQTVLEKEVDFYNSKAQEWWNTKDGMFAPLHKYISTRIDFLALHAKPKGDGRLDDMRILDVGCGGGILSEALAKRGATVVGIDPSLCSIDAAEHHRDSNLPTDIARRIHYKCSELCHIVNECKDSTAMKFDVVIASEVIEHVDNAQLLVSDISSVLKQDGVAVFTTINKNPIAWFGLIAMAEYVFGLLPKGTHSYKMLVSPKYLKQLGLQSQLIHLSTQGTLYSPLLSKWYLVPFSTITYMIAFRKPKK